ncbi:EbsA family protein [Streptococcus suis]|uniref:EbsA family protein n=1 Tax=Streptococcus suis TaxID=1307 RepID=UPI000CF37401|nr:EbsA family protein [Streptococcus suis]NQP18899.1 EbsA family protein [Streptococcus suis]UUM58495.1 EbsA family protein [Streptococcus suis]UUM61654.1 EbsA family protein [Streptococcus suis]
MIRLFGKLRYHWQPDFATSMIYWSLSLVPLFLGLSLILERSRQVFIIFLLLFTTIVLAILGSHRYFLIEDENLYIASANLFKNKKIDIASISKVKVNYLSISICRRNEAEELTFCMRKWPKKYFINALALHPKFQGEIELVDHLVKQDYFEVYYSDEAKSLRKNSLGGA